jgi:DNA-binding Lrp family transcriptional regulator
MFNIKKSKMEGHNIAVAYIFIHTIPELEHKVYTKLSDEKKIVDLHPLYREYDIVAKVKIINQDKLGLFVKNKIRSLEGVLDTKTVQ